MHLESQQTSRTKSYYQIRENSFDQKIVREAGKIKRSSLEKGDLLWRQKINGVSYINANIIDI